MALNKGRDEKQYYNDNIADYCLNKLLFFGAAIFHILSYFDLGFFSFEGMQYHDFSIVGNFVTIFRKVGSFCRQPKTAELVRGCR